MTTDRIQQPRDDGGPAFPAEIGARPIGQNWHQTGPHTAQHYGMSLRDHYAGLAMQSILQAAFQLCSATEKEDAAPLAEAAFHMADAMLEERAKTAPSAP